MSSMLVLILLGVVGIIALWFILSYNGFIRLRNQADEAWSDIDVQLKRRYDLIPNLVNAVKGYMTHEASVLENVTKARTLAMGAQTLEEHAKAENMLSGALKSLFAVAEQYPDLKATGNFMQLQDELSDTENKIQAARRFYNNNVRLFNTKQQSFPDNIIASIFSFTAKSFFELEDKSERAVPEVKF